MATFRRHETHMERLLTVTEVIHVEKRGVLVLPQIPLKLLDGKLLPRMAELRRPDGSTVQVAVHLDIPRVTPPPAEIAFLCQIPNATVASVPAGTEVWAELLPSGKGRP
jgi:hypothetical protein